jgi:hypothetical protein
MEIDEEIIEKNNFKYTIRQIIQFILMFATYGSIYIVYGVNLYS